VQSGLATRGLLHQSNNGRKSDNATNNKANPDSHTFDPPLAVCSTHSKPLIVIRILGAAKMVIERKFRLSYTSSYGIKRAAYLGIADTR